MSGVVGKRFRRPIRRFQDMKTALTLLGNNSIKYIVLEQSIRETVVNNFPMLLGKIDALEHPISPGQAELCPIDLAEPIRFGFLGLADKAKGFPLFVDLASHVTGKYKGRTEFHAIGHFPREGTVVNRTEALATKPETTLMSRANFHDRVNLLHFVVLPHDPIPYTLTASGVLIDAIAWGKPVIARKIPIFEAMFERHGDIGHLFKDDLDLMDIVEYIVKVPDKSRYHRQVLNLRSARQSRMPENLATSYRQLCEIG
jgi:glycosyltransferase involved in cell wall biosynthesis